MRHFRRIYNITRDLPMLDKGKWCVSYWCHFRGLMFRFNLPDNEGLIFVRNRPSVANTTIHMFFCFFPIGVLWLDEKLQVVDARLARPWRPYYAPRVPAQYYIEARPAILERVSIGDQLRFDDTP
jgi:uncharacterized membrane protein (UPF0127 family)